MSYLATLKNLSKNSWIPIRRRVPVNSLSSAHIHLW